MVNNNTKKSSQSLNQIKFKVDKKLAGQRLDVAPLEKHCDLSRRKLRKIIDTGGAYINGKRVRIASRKLHEHDLVEFVFSEQALSAKIKKIELTAKDILSENEDFVAIAKPPHLVSQPTRDQAISHVMQALKDYYMQSNLLTAKEFQTFELVHRLDKETSGVLLVAKHKKATTELMQGFKQKTFNKIYHAICIGIPKEDEFEVVNHLSSIQPKTGKVKAVKSGGKKAHTRFKVLARHKQKNISLIECYPSTGRSHQLRLHLADLGLPIVGDKKYGESLQKTLVDDVAVLAQQHHMLHAFKLEFSCFEKNFKLQAGYPKDFKKLVEILK